MSTRPTNKENLMALADTIAWAAGAYGSMIDTESQAGEIDEPTTAPKGGGHLVAVVYTGFAPDRKMLWEYDLTNTTWHGVELL